MRWLEGQCRYAGHPNSRRNFRKYKNLKAMFVTGRYSEPASKVCRDLTVSPVRVSTIAATNNSLNPKSFKSRFGFDKKISPVPDFAAGGRADFGDNFERGRHLLARKPFAAKRNDVFGCSLLVTGTQLHFGVDRFAHLRMRPGGNAR